MVTRSDVDNAADRIRRWVRRTPVIASDEPDVWFKLEYLQHTGSFKARGALNRLLAARESGELDPGAGIVVASGGNAGIAYAYAAARTEVPATVFVPETTPPVKVATLRSYGAQVEMYGREYAVASEGAQAHAERSGAMLCHAYDQPTMVAGAGTISLELMEQLRGAVDAIVVATGGGGLMAGVAAAAEGVARVIAVEPATCATLSSAIEQGRPVDVSISGIAADSLGARRLGSIAFEVAKRSGVHSVLVSDDDVASARRLLWARYRIVVEYGAAAAMAALTGGAYVPRARERVVVVLCGANTDPSSL